MSKVVSAITTRRKVVLLTALLSLTAACCTLEAADEGDCPGGDAPCGEAPEVLLQTAVPKRYERELCVGDRKSGEVLVFDAAEDGDHPPLRRIGTDATRIDTPRSIAIADAHGEMLVAERDRITTWGIDDRGNVAPRRELAFKADQIAVDPKHDLLLAVAENRLFVFPRNAAGNPTASVIRSIAGDPAHPWKSSRVVYDDVRDEIIIVSDNMIGVYDWSATDAAPKYAIYAPAYNDGEFLDAAVDARTGEIYVLRRTYSGQVQVQRHTRSLARKSLDLRSSWVVPEDDDPTTNGHPAVGGFGIDVEHDEAVVLAFDRSRARLLVFDLATGAFKLRIAGPHTRLHGSGRLTVNPARHEYTVTQESSHSLNTFARPNGTRSPLDLAPRRIGRPFGEGPLGIAADVARGELYITAPNDPAIHVVSLSTGTELRRVIDPEHPAGGELLFDASSDRLFVLDFVVRMYERPNSETIEPVATFEMKDHWFIDMALDVEHQRLFANDSSTVAVFSLQSGSTEPVFSFSPAVAPLEWSPVIPVRPFPQPPPKGIREIAVHNNQLFASTYDGRIAVFTMLGAPPVPANPPLFRGFDVGFSNSDDFLIDGRAPKGLHAVSRLVEPERIATYAPGLFAGPAPVRTIAGPRTGINMLSSIALCR